ncbi:unnamed protein product [Discula destructiva]
MRKIPTARTSRRAPGLKDSDYDHEIALVDHAAEAVTPQQLSPDLPAQTEQTDHAPSTPQNAATDEALSRRPTAVSATSTAEPGASSLRKDPSGSRSGASASASASGASSSVKSKISKGSLTKKKSSLRRHSKPKSDIPRVEVEVPTPVAKPHYPTRNGKPRDRASRETAIDILYENQRGGFLCGIPLFSPKALGQLDPPAWTNFAHKPSPTNIHNAQVPDPSWVWVWPEWHINKDVGVDDNGFEYSFMFAKTFSWHPPRWYNSFVRRRAWTRQRTRRDPTSNDPHMLNAEYFTVRPSVDTVRSGSKASSRRSRASMSFSSSFDGGEKLDIETIEMLMSVLSQARIDREKIEAVENFLDHGEEELSHLQHKMHDIMAIFVFQASRRVLLTKLSEVFDATLTEVEKSDTERLQRRADTLKAAIKHADEECTRLEYWSDQKRLVIRGDTGTATDKCKGWNACWQGVDKSGPEVPDTSKGNN